MISVVIPCYNEEANLQKLYERTSGVTKSMPNYKFEIIFIDDCSKDKTSHILEKIAENDNRVEIIRFARNCGSHAAVAAGLQFCNGNAAVMIAADLQDPPEIIPKLLFEWESGFKVVWGVRNKRKGESLITLLYSRAFYFLMNLLTGVSQSPTGADVFLIDRVVIEAFKQAPEKNTSIYMMIAWLGYTQTSVTYIKDRRHAGTSKWTASKRIKLFFDSLISFSYVPLRFMSLMGTVSAFFGLFYGIIIFLNALRGNPVQGWSSLMIVVLVIGGLQMIMMGMLGEYLWRTYDETRGRPKYVIEKNTLLDSHLSFNKRQLNENYEFNEKS